jgi:hypothetical protein
MSVDLERQALTILDTGLAERSRNELIADPVYSPWPPPGFEEVALSEARIELVVLARMKAALDFGAGLTGENGDELRTSVDVTWPALSAGGHYERVTGEASVRANGDVEWGYTHGGTSAPALPVETMSGLSSKSGRTALDLYVQNTLRLAVLAEASSLGS